MWDPFVRTSWPATLRRSHMKRARATVVSDLRTPALVCKRSLLERNASRMLQRASDRGCVLRPHLKTCKTLEAAAIATGGTRRRVTVSTLAEASFFAAGGFDDILYAVPLTPDKLPQALELNALCQSFGVMVDHMEQVDALVAPEAPPRAKPLDVWVAVDCGYHRDGVDPDDADSVALVRRLVDSAATRFAGIYTHAGHSYDAKSGAEVEAIAVQERDVTVRFAAKLRAADLAVPTVGVGSTPTCSRPPVSDALAGARRC